jgi:hypothetical protein
MSIGYLISSFLMAFLFIVTFMAAQQGWGLSSDVQAKAEAQARAQSVRTGSTHYRTYYGGGPGYGK